jgi:hypothetical protein
MCSSPKGSNQTTVNKPRTRGLLADMSPSARSSYAAKANAADNRKAQRVAREQKIRRWQNRQLADESEPANAVVSLTWYHQLWQFFYYMPM